MSAIAWMVSAPRPPEAWPSDARRVCFLETAADEVPYTDMDLATNKSPDDVKRHRGGRPPNSTSEKKPRRAAGPKLSKADEMRLYRERSAAAIGVVYLPLEPGQKRRRRAHQDGRPVCKGEVIPYCGPRRAPGEMAYGQAARLIRQANDGELVDLDDLARAHATVADAREQAIVE